MFDGRNRLAAAADAGIEPVFEAVDLDDHAIFARVVSENVHRRHLTDAQRAVVAAKLVLALRARGTPDGRASETVGAQLGLSARTIEEALAVVTKGVEGLPELVTSGAIGVSVAAAVARTEATAQRAAVTEGPAAVRGLAKQLRAARADLRAGTSAPPRKSHATAADEPAEPAKDLDEAASIPSAAARTTPTEASDGHQEAAPPTLDLDEAVARSGYKLDRHQSRHASARLVLELDEGTYQRWSRRLRRHDLAAAAFELLERAFEAAGG